LNSDKGENEIAHSVLQAIAEYKAEVEGDYTQLANVVPEEKVLVADTSK